MSAEQEARRPWQREGHPLVLAGEPRLAYQPVVDLMSGQLLGFEGLLRWDHPTEGVIPPGLLLPLAEANGDIVILGHWVLEEGCRQAVEWPTSVQLAVNCSVVQLQRAEMSKSVIAALEASGLSPDRLTIEVTESALSNQAAVADLRAITRLGVQVAVDDVGTSWNSFDILRRLAVNTVKIDESFVNGLEPREGINRMVVETVVQLAHNAGMATVAEGVETALHAAIVREFDSDAAQGYFFAPPLSAASATRVANMHDLRFPLSGPGWKSDDNWPFEGVEAEDGGARGTPPLGARSRVNPAATSPPAQLDTIDLVDLALGQQRNPPVSSAASGTNGHNLVVDGNGATASNGTTSTSSAGATSRSEAPAAGDGARPQSSRSAGARRSSAKGAPAQKAQPTRAASSKAQGAKAQGAKAPAARGQAAKTPPAAKKAAGKPPASGGTAKASKPPARAPRKGGRRA